MTWVEAESIWYTQQETIESFGEEGDVTRKHLLNPAIFQTLGDVRDRTILDAGCGIDYWLSVHILCFTCTSPYKKVVEMWRKFPDHQAREFTNNECC